MKKVIIWGTILLSVFTLAGCGSKKKSKSALEEELKTFSTLESVQKEVVVQLPIPEEVSKISQDNTGSKEFVPADELKVVKATTDAGEEIRSIY
ncbi:LptM family lipoprotein [Enterococcus rivorum]|uniref:LptM family lipoprotein n=1 Tax=Enterococcus rivorum TaxID=762845 RepID=UPI003627535D